MQPAVILLRGLNTYGDDFQRMGPLKFGDVYKHWRHSLPQWKTIFVQGMGPGPVEVMASNALNAIQAHPLWQEPGQKFHILGHSTGGVVARALAHRPEIHARVLSVTTVATPHRGTYAADEALQLHPIIQKVCTWVGYDLKERSRFFNDLSTETMTRFNHAFPDREGVRYASIVAEKPLYGPCFFFQVGEYVLEKSDQRSDGLIPVESQSWGRVLTQVSLDHYEVMGFCFRTRPEHRNHARKEYERMILAIESFWRSINP